MWKNQVCLSAIGWLKIPCNRWDYKNGMKVQLKTLCVYSYWMNMYQQYVGSLKDHLWKPMQSLLKLSIAFSLLRYRNRQCFYSALLGSNSPRLCTVFKYAIMHLLHVSCREAVVHDMQFKQWFLFSWHFIVNCMAKGQFWSCLTSQTDNNLPFFFSPVVCGILPS